MSRDEDRHEERLDEDERALAEVAGHAGFELRRPRKRPWEELALDAMPVPQNVVARITGQVRGAIIDVYEYEVAVPEQQNPRTVVAAVIRHPGISGQANVTRKDKLPWYAWILLAPILVFVLPVMGLWLLGSYLFERLNRRKGPPPLKWEDRTLGSKKFQDAYTVKAPSLEHATAGMPPALQAVLEASPHAQLQVKPGVLACTLPLARLDRGSAAHALELAEALLGTIAGASAPAQTPYRVSVPMAPGAEAPAALENATVEIEDDPDPIARRN